MNPLKKNDLLRIKNGKIHYFVSKPSYVKLEINNADGSVVKTFISGKHRKGWHKLELDESTDKFFGSSYFIRMSIDGKSVSIQRLFFKN